MVVMGGDPDARRSGWAAPARRRRARRPQQPGRQLLPGRGRGADRGCGPAVRAQPAWSPAEGRTAGRRDRGNRGPDRALPGRAPHRPVHRHPRPEQPRGPPARRHRAPRRDGGAGRPGPTRRPTGAAGRAGCRRPRRRGPQPGGLDRPAPPNLARPDGRRPVRPRCPHLGPVAHRRTRLTPSSGAPGPTAVPPVRSSGPVRWAVVARRTGTVVLIVLVFLVAGSVSGLLPLQIKRVSTGSMTPTIDPGDLLMVQGGGAAWGRDGAAAPDPTAGEVLVSGVAGVGGSPVATGEAALVVGGGRAWAPRGDPTRLDGVWMGP